MDPTPVIDFPLSGQWLVLNPPGHTRWAFDMLALAPDTGCLARDGWRRTLAGRLHVQDVYGWGQTVRAPIQGEVVAVHDAEPDRQRLSVVRDVPAAFLIRPLRSRGDLAAMAGNHAVIASPVGSVLLAHLRRGSVRVQQGQTIGAGEVIGEVGNSGNTVGPHLHLQVMDGADPTSAPIVRFLVRRYDQWDGQTWQPRTNAGLPSRRARIRVSAAS